jgi:hypothetical protein
MKREYLVGLLAAILLFSLTTPATGQEKPGSGWAVDVKAGTFGIGGDLSRSIVPRALNLRVGASFFPYTTDFDEEGISYNARLKLSAIPIALDAFPFKNWFRISGGVVINLNEVTGTARSAEGTVDLGGTTYNLSSLGQLNGKVKFNRASPYFGLGFNNPIKKSGHLGFFTDLGVMYHGNPKASLTVTNQSIPGLQQSIDKEVQEVNQDLEGFSWFPVIQFGLSYKF